MNDLLIKSLDGIESKLNASAEERRELADRVQQLEQRGAISGMDHGNAPSQSAGAQVAVKFAENADLFSKTKGSVT